MFHSAVIATSIHFSILKSLIVPLNSVKSRYMVAATNINDVYSSALSRVTALNDFPNLFGCWHGSFIYDPHLSAIENALHC